MTVRLPLLLSLLAAGCVQPVGPDSWRDDQAADRADVQRAIAELDAQKLERERLRSLEKTVNAERAKQRRLDDKIQSFVTPVAEQLEKLAGEVEVVRRDRIALDQSDDGLQDQIVAISGRLQKEQRAHAELATKVQEREQSLRSELGKQYAEGRAELAKLIDELERASDARRRKEAGVLRDAIADLGDRLEKERSAHKAAVAALQEREAKLRKELEQSSRLVQTQLAQSAELAQSQRSTTSTLGKKVQDLRAEITRVTSRLDRNQKVAAQAESAERTKLAKRLGTDLNALREDVTKLSTAVQRATETSTVAIRRASTERLDGFTKLLEQASDAAALGDATLVASLVDQRGMIEKLGRDLGATKQQGGKAMQEVRGRLDTILERLQTIEQRSRPRDDKKPADKNLVVQVEEALDMLHALDRKVARIATSQKEAARIATAQREQGQRTKPAPDAATSKRVDALAKQLDQRLKAIEEARAASEQKLTAASEQKLTKELSGLRTAIAKDVDTKLAAKAAGGDDAAKALLAGVDKRFAALESARKTAESGFAKSLDALRVAITKDVDAKLVTGSTDSRGAVADLWTKIDGRFKALDEARARSETDFAKRLGELRDGVTKEVDSKLAKSDTTSGKAIDAAFKRLDGKLAQLSDARKKAEERVTASLAETQNKLLADVDARMEQLDNKTDAVAVKNMQKLRDDMTTRFVSLAKDWEKRDLSLTADLNSMREKLAGDLDAKLQPLTASVKANNVSDVRDTLNKLADRMDGEGVRRSKAERDLGARLEVLGEQVGSMHKSIVSSLAAKADRSELEARASGDIWSQPWLWAVGGAVLVLLLWLLLRKGPELDLLQEDVFVVAEEEVAAPPSQRTHELAVAALAGPEELPKRAEVKPRREVVATGTAERTGNGKRHDPAPRVQSLRIAAEETAPGGDDAVRGLLQCDPRVLVEPAPRIESRPDGSLSIRFYVRGQIDMRDAEELTKSCRSLATRGRAG